VEGAPPISSAVSRRCCWTLRHTISTRGYIVAKTGFVTPKTLSFLIDVKGEGSYRLDFVANKQRRTESLDIALVAENGTLLCRFGMLGILFFGCNVLDEENASESVMNPISM
jgi:hypothetical protein